MAYTITGLAECIVKFTQQSTQPLNITYSGSPNRDFVRQFASTDITKLYFNTYTVGTSATTIDLTSLTDAYGQSISFGTVKALLVVNNDATNNLTVGGGTNGLFSTLPFTLNGQTVSGSQQGSALSIITPITVDGTHKILSLTASASTISVDVFVAGI